jgi:PAS domain S-box-containing protein
MYAQRLDLRLFIIGSFAVLLAMFGVYLLVEGASFVGFFRQPQTAVFLMTGTLAVFLVMGLGVPIIRQRTREAKINEIQFQSLLEAAPEALVITDWPGRILLVNAQAERLFGYDREELLGQSLARFLCEQVREGHAGPGLDEFNPYTTRHNYGAPRYTGRRKDGREIPVEVTFSPLETKHGSCLINIIRDITERQTRERCRAARHAVRRILAEAPALREAAPSLLQASCECLGWDLGALWTVAGPENRLRRVALWHSPAVRLSEFEKLSPEITFAASSDLPGRVFKSGKPLGIADVVRDREEQQTAGGDSDRLRGAVGFPIMVGGKVFGVIELLCHESREPDENLLETGSLIAAQVGQFVERERAEETLRQTEEKFRQSQKMEAIGKLAGGVAHDFNNLLTVILGCSEVLLQTPHLEKSSQGLLEEIRHASLRAADLIRQLLAFSRKQVLAPQVLDLNTVVTDTNKMLRRLIGRDIELIPLLAPALRRVKIDPGQLAQVLMNLAVNARDAMPGGGKLTIETASAELDETYTRGYSELRPGPYVVLAVSDTGCGITAEVKARIFEPFFTTKGAGKGTGLGLATVYGIIKQSGGHIAVYSEPGQGTTFKIYLPCVEEVDSAPVSSPSSPVQLDGTETVLLVEDDEKLRQFSGKILQARGYQVLEAASAEEAFRLCAQHDSPIHFLVTDVVMPGMNGGELARHLLAQRPGLRVLFVSGYTNGALSSQNRLIPDTAFLEKPFTPRALACKVREVLNQRSEVTDQEPSRSS